LRSVRPSVNVVHRDGQGALRIAAMGFEARPAGADDLRGMERLLGEAMDAGAWGFSTGLVYPPSAYANTEELIALARSMRPRHGFYFSHVRGESSMLLDSIAEAIRIGDEGGVPAQIAHVKASGRENWSKLDGALGLIDEARRRGVDVAGDVYPYNAGSTKMDNLIPAWAHEGGVGKLLDRPGKPHPRSYGTFPRVLSEYARERKLFALETAVHKMTGLPAARLGLRDRGVVSAGAVADLAVFDAATVKDESTYPDPHRYPT